MEEQRAEIAYIAKLIFLNSQRRLPFENEDLIALNYVSKNLKILEDKLNNTIEDNIQELFGGEFSLSYEKSGDDLLDMNMYNSNRIPLFLVLDFSKAFLETQYINNSRVSEKVKEIARNLISNINQLREKFSKLKCNNIFDSNKHISKEILEKMKEDNDGIANFGIEYIQNYSFDTKKIFGEPYVVLNKDISTASIGYKNGEPFTEKSNNSSNEIFIFEEDKKEINGKIVNEYNSKLEEKKKLIYPTLKKYFGIENIDQCDLRELFYKIENSNLDARLFEPLKRIIDEKRHIDKKYFFNREEEFLFSYVVENIILQIHNIEKTIEEESKEKEHRTSVESARKRYREKNFLWKLLNRKLNPTRLNLNSMDNDELDNLYVERRK